LGGWRGCPTRALGELFRGCGKLGAMKDFYDAGLVEASWSEPELFGMIFDRHFDAIHRYLARRLRHEDADDLAGEVFRIAFERRHSYDTMQQSALPWLYGMASNLVLKHHRRERRALRALARQRSLASAPLHVDGTETRVDARVDAAASRPAIVAALLALAADERNLVMLAALTDLTYAELAQAVELPVGTVRSKLSRTKTKLRERLGPVGEEDIEPSRSHETGEAQ